MSSESKKHTGDVKRYFVVIYNARAGRKKEKVRERISDFFVKKNISYEITDVDGCLWSEIVAKTKEFDEVRFVAAGGDGTLRLVFQKMWEHDLLSVCPVAFLPLGSANVTALSFKLPFGLRRGLTRAMHGKPKYVDLGLVNEKYIFFIMVSFGTVSRFVVETKRNMKKKFGIFAYLLYLPSLLHHSYEEEKFTITDGAQKESEMHSVLICNHLNIAGLTPARGIAPDDKNLHCITLHNKNPLGILRGAHDFYMTTKNSKVLHHTRIQKEKYVFKNFTGEVHIDGDTFTDLGDIVEFRILPHAAKLVM
ncbi:hypothetical protein CL644_01970 [bacterium]|nr:hypothetical protein [Parcubacteria group bacterium]MBF05450.1 hypothetical protein [bacterium]|tara:strand:- start:1213 stop:2133 length:921 start_codon:yes stop_codon:yes gene_type:complete